MTAGFVQFPLNDTKIK